jgi:hypothetical protein
MMCNSVCRSYKERTLCLNDDLFTTFPCVNSCVILAFTTLCHRNQQVELKSCVNSCARWVLFKPRRFLKMNLSRYIVKKQHAFRA